MKEGFLIDMDGVIYRENHLIPGAAEFVDTLNSRGIPFLFLTNNSAPTPEELAVRLRHLGIEGVSPRQFYTSALNTADFLSETHPNCTAYVLGEGGLLAALHEKKIPNDSINPSYVIVGEGAVPIDKLAKAHEHIERGARLLSTNPDNWCPVGAEKTRPGAGATTAFLEASTGKHAYYLGKPNGFMFQRAQQKLCENSFSRPERVIMIGDTMETDIRGAFEAGLAAFLVMTGSTSLDDVLDYSYQPSRILNSIADLREELDTGIPSNRLNSPAFKPLNGNGKRAGRQHQTDYVIPRKKRPRPAMVN
jgi:NagD protein